MLELYKQVLHKVSFDRRLFEKELRKSLKRISKEDIKQFQKWCLITFGVMYPEVIQNVFESI